LTPWYDLALPGIVTTTAALGRDGTLHVGDASETLHAFSPAGDPQWRVALPGLPIGAPVVARDGTVSVIVEGADEDRVVAIGADGVVRFDLAIGRWTAPLAIGP